MAARKSRHLGVLFFRGLCWLEAALLVLAMTERVL